MVAERVMPTLSASWKASLPMRCVGTCPVKATMRDRVHQRVLERGHQVGGGGPGGDEADADLAGRPRVALRRMPGGGLLAHQDVADALEVVQGVVDRQHRAARQTEDEIHPFPLQALQHDPRA